MTLSGFTVLVTIVMPLKDLIALPKAVAFQMHTHCDSTCKKIIRYANEICYRVFFFIFYIPFACLFWPDVYCTYFLIHVFITAYTIKVLYTHYLSVLIFLQYQLDVFAIVPTLTYDL